MLFEGNQEERNQANKLNLIDTRHEAILLMFGGSRDTLDERVDTYYNKGNRTDGNQTETIEEALGNSMLKYLDVTQANEIDLKEAFCRDIDAFNTAFSVGIIYQIIIISNNQKFIFFRLMMDQGLLSAKKYHTNTVQSCMTASSVREAGHSMSLMELKRTSTTFLVTGVTEMMWTQLELDMAVPSQDLHPLDLLETKWS